MNTEWILLANLQSGSSGGEYRIFVKYKNILYFVNIKCKYSIFTNKIYLHIYK